MIKSPSSIREKMIAKKHLRMMKSKKIEVVYEVPLHIDLPPLTRAFCRYDFISSLATDEGKLLTVNPHAIWITDGAMDGFEFKKFRNAKRKWSDDLFIVQIDSIPDAKLADSVPNRDVQAISDLHFYLPEHLPAHTITRAFNKELKMIRRDHGLRNDKDSLFSLLLKASRENESIMKRTDGRLAAPLIQVQNARKHIKV